MSGVLAVMDGEIASAEALAVSDAYQAERLPKLREARAAVAELIERDRWIPVNESLPDDPEEEVIVWRLYDAARTGVREEWEVDTSRWDGDEWLFGAMTDYVQVTHWRPMPLGPDAALARVQGGQS